MTRQEELREQYEDALFTLLMEEVAVAEGEEFLRESEALRGDPEAAVPEEVIRRCRRTINRCFSRQRRRSLARQFRWVFQKASVVALLGVLLFSAVYAISPEFRVGVLNLVVETLDESTDVSFGKEGTEEAASLQLEVGWVPEGAALTDEGQNSTRSWKYYKVDGTYNLKIDVMQNEGQLTSWDTEDSVVVPITIGERAGQLIINDNIIYLAIIDIERSVTITVWSDGIRQEEIIRVGESIRY